MAPDKNRYQEYDDFESLRKLYFERFGVEAPHCMPIEIEGCSEDMREALRTGIPLPPMPEGYVT
jgi:hypothetical protein